MPDRPFMMNCRAAVICALVLSAVPAVAQDIRDLVTIENQIWGFDGRVTAGQFNPVSFLIDNRLEEPIDATASLTRSAGLGGTSGGRIEQPVYIGAGARRWVQFYPYIESDNPSEWELRIGRIRFDPQVQPRSTDLPVNDQEKKAPLPVSVILDAPGSMERQPTSVKHFPEDIFPPWGSATFGLRTVFMDHVPDWEEPRQAALMSWLQRGGNLVLLKGGRGDWPAFSGTLAELSQPLERYCVGAGEVRRVDLQRRDLSEAMVDSLARRDETANADDALQETVDEIGYGYGYGYAYESPEWMDENWSQQLRQLTTPEHAWWLIFLLSLVYILLIFPGCWILSKQNRGFMTVYGAIAGIAVLFSVMFLLIGQRGYGEATTLNTIALSHLEGDTAQSVMEWNALFVTSGDQYTVSATDEQSLFAIPGQRERSNAVFREGDAGDLSISIPPFSSQTFVCRRQRLIADWQLEVRELELSSSGLSKAVISFGPGLELLQPTDFAVLYGNRMYSMTKGKETKALRLGRSLKSLAEYAQSSLDNGYYMSYGWNSYLADDGEDGFYEKIMPGLVLRSVLDSGTRELKKFRLPRDRLRLFVFAEYPAAEHVQTSAECATNGRILYVRDVILDSSKVTN